MSWRATFDFDAHPHNKLTAKQAVSKLQEVFGLDIEEKHSPEYVIPGDDATLEQEEDPEWDGWQDEGDKYIKVRFFGYCPEALSRARAAGISCQEGG